MNLITLYKKLTNRKYNIGYKFILSLFVGLIGFISFCNAGSYTYSGSVLTAGDYNVINFTIPQSYLSTDFVLNCTFYADWNGTAYFTPNINYSYGSYNHVKTSLSEVSFTAGQDYNYTFDFSTYEGYGGSRVPNGYFLFRFEKLYQPFGDSSPFNYTCTFSGDNIISAGGSCPDCPTCDPQYTSEECQSVYGLVSSGLLTTCENNYNICQSDLNTCQSNTSGFNDLLNNCSNNLNACNNSLSSCLQQNCPETTTGINRSSLFINNIQYPGAPTIKFTIPEEIERDQYTDEEETNIDVVGYGYDQAKMQQMVNTQYYKPTAEEMNGLMEKVAEFLPLVAIALLITRLRRVIKKVF